MNENRLFLPEGSLTLLAARPMIGKDAFSVTIAQKLQKQYPQKQVLYFSLEKPRKYLYCYYRIPSDTKLCVIDHLFCLEDICSTSRLIHKSSQLGLIVVDYLQLVECLEGELMISEHDSYENRERKQTGMMDYIIDNLKRLAKELHVPVLVTAYPARNIDDRVDKYPVIRDLRYAKISEQDADQVWFLYRDSYYNDKADKQKSELTIEKNRYGNCETMQISYETMGKYSWFTGFTISYNDI